MSPAPSREELALDVLFVGGGPACLAALWRLLDLVEAHNRRPGVRKLEGLCFGLIEKAEGFGDHAFSGAILDPSSLRELCPDFLARGFPSEGVVQAEEVWVLSSDHGGVKLPVLPTFLGNRGAHVVSLSRMVRWMAELIGAREVPGVEVLLLPGFAGQEVLWEGGRVAGVRTADRGLDGEGRPRVDHQPGTDLKARVTVFGEGPRGHLARELEAVLGLQAQSPHPQVFEMGVKEVWELPEGRLLPGSVLHCTGWPQEEGESGGGFLYGLSGNRAALGFVVSLDTRDPFADAHECLQRLKGHPRFAEVLEGGRPVEYGAKALAIGGWHAMPRLAFEGGMLLGDAAQMVDAARLKGIHLGLKAGLCAAECLLDALLEDAFDELSLQRYAEAFRMSWAGQELRASRGVHGILSRGPEPMAALKLGLSRVTGGWVPGGGRAPQSDADRTSTTEAYYGKPGIHRCDLGPGVHPDGRWILGKLDALFLSGTRHDERQPCHLHLVGDPGICAQCHATMGAPCTVFCPAQVYEMRSPSGGEGPRLEIAFANCLHCKTCDIKCPGRNVIWTPPQGGGGPRYTLC
nr:electron-transfer flavoprotein:ubiquinone oxidoreductase [uncultured Holophaga sp.]